MKLTCGAAGDLKLESVEVSAFLLIELPRRWDDPDRRQDEHPAQQLHIHQGDESSFVAEKKNP